MSDITSPRLVNAKFPEAPSNPPEIVNDLRQRANNAQKSPDWATTPAVQSAIQMLSVDADELEKLTMEVDDFRKKLAHAEQALAQKIVDCKQHRKLAESTITTASNGSVASVLSWGCDVAKRTRRTPTDEAPQNLSAKNGRNPGDTVARCPGVRAQAFVFQHAESPAFPPGSPEPVVLSTSTYKLTGLPPGKTLYFRAAVVRPGTGQSRWSEPVQLTVR